MHRHQSESRTGTLFGFGRRLCFLAVVTFAARAAFASAADPVSVRVLEDTGDRIVIGYEFGDFTRTPVRIDGQAYTRITLGKEALMKEVVGGPELPHVCRSIIIPDDAQMAVQVVASDYYELTDVDVAPSKGSILRTVNPDDVPYTFGEVYETDAFYPGEPAALREPYIMRDHRGIVVAVNPFQYNPVARVLRVYTEITVEVFRVGLGQVNVLERPLRPRELSLAFHQIYKHHFLNYGLGLRDVPLDETGDMLIICHDPWIPNVQPLAGHKSSIGISTTIVGVSTIGNNATAIKNYIQGVYDAGHLSFVVLVGDAAQIATPYASGGASDPTYSLLAGSDSYPEIMVGRLSAETTAQVDTQVERTIEYENMPATLQDWFWRGTGIASNQGPGDNGEYDNEHMEVIRGKLLDYGYTLVDQIYDPGASAAEVTAAVNDGRGIVNYCGHGGPTGWGTTGFSNTHVNALVNDNMLPFITSVACNTGEFDSYTCFGEAWMRAMNGPEPTGAIGIYASSVSQYWDEPMRGQDGFIDLYVTETYLSLGTLLYGGSCLMMDYYGSSGVDMFVTWILFGDPSLRVVGTVAPPTGMRVRPNSGLISEGPNGGPFTPDSITYTLANYETAPIDYTVSKNAGWIDLSDTGGTIPAEGEVDVVVSINSSANNLGNGYYEDTVTFTNTTNHDGDTTRTVSLQVGVPMPTIVFDLSTSPGWSTSGQWAFGQPTGQGGTSFGYPDPTSGATGANVYGVNLNGDYSTTPGGPYYLTTDAVDCSQLTRAELHFQRWLNTDYQPYVYATLDVSNDGTSWQSIWQNGGSGEVAENSWSEQVYDISAFADEEATVYIRWGYQVDSGAFAYSGWNIDDIEIWGVPALIDCNGNGVPDDEDIANGTSQDCNANSVPDECDLAGGVSQDCNANEVPDECDIAGCTDDPACMDCNDNGVPDGCDLDQGTSQDSNENGVPDECDAYTPQPENSFLVICTDDEECAHAATCVEGVCYAPKNRYLSVSPNPNGLGKNTARRVGLNVDGMEPVLLGWVAAPQFNANAGIWTATLESEPSYCGVDFEGDWPDVVHITGCMIAPGQTYLIQAIVEGQATDGESNYSEALALPTAPIWGDVVSTCPNDICQPPEGDPSTQPNIDDVLALVNAFIGVNNAPPTWLDIDPVVGDGYPEGMIVIGDVLAVVNAFQGASYPGFGPLGCP